MRFVAGQVAGAQNHREANPAKVRQIAGQGALAESHREDVACQGDVAESHREDVAGRGAAAERLQRGGTAAERLCGRVPESAGNVSPWIAAAANKPPGNAPHVNAPRGTCHPGTHCSGNALCGEYYSPALRRSAFSATWSWSITS